MAISGDTIVVGAHQEDSSATGVNGDGSDDSALQSGAAYVFERSGGVWSSKAYLKASFVDANDEFGCSVAVSGAEIVVGARAEDSGAANVPWDNGTTGSGAVVVHR